jgi:alanine-glyoxylate transaminase/serine-glyoxylate transaminase/serine-pyruvate transaminase
MTGRHYVAIPGPSVLPDRVLSAMHRSSPDIYAPEVEALAASVAGDLKRLAGTSGHLAMYLCNGHGTWEAMATNLFSPGDHVLILVCGTFGHGWASVLTGLGLAPQVLDFGRQSPADPERLTAALRADPAIKAVLVTHVDTATTVRCDIPALRAAMDAAGSGALLAVDCVATMGCDRFEMDAWGVDVVLSASQKGLMAPPGMGMVWFSDKALDMGAGAKLRTPYWDWTLRARPQEFWQYWFGTAPTHHLYALRESLTMMLDEEGLAALWARHESLARAVWAAVETWGAGNPEIGLNLADPHARGRSVTSVRLGAPQAALLRDWVVPRGLTLGIGLGMGTEADPRATGWLRIAHMGHVNAHMTLGALAVMEAGLQALGIAHGKGALEAAAAAL